MDTTTVLSMRSLTTLPTRTFLRLRSDVAVMLSVLLSLGATRARGSRLGHRRGGLLLLVEDREQPRHPPAALANLERVVELLHGVPEAQVEQLLAKLRHARVDLVDAHVAHGARLDVRHGLTLLPARDARRTACESATSRRPASSLPVRTSSRSLPIRTARGLASQRTPRIPGLPCPCPYGSRRASS